MPDIFNSVDPGNIIRAHLLHHAIQIEYDVSNNPIFVGWALPGADILTPVWRIAKITYVGTNPTVVRWPNGTNQYLFVWNDRASLTYS